MKRPTLHDVAREAGVSHMTVARVLHGQRVVRPDTAAKVCSAVERLGYRPDPVLSALAAYRRRSGDGAERGAHLAFIDCDGSEYSQKVFDGVRAEAALFGYACEAIRLPLGATRQTRLARVLFHRGIRGLLFGPSDTRRTFADWGWERFATVSLAALSHRPAMHAVSLDYFHGAASACERLHEAGRRRIALVIDPQLEMRTGGLWVGGYMAATLGRQKPLVCPAETIRDKDALAAWLRRRKLDGVLTVHSHLRDVLAASGAETLFLNQEGEGYPWAHYHLPPADIGREGVRLLHHALLRQEWGLPGEPKHVALRGSWTAPAVC